MTVHYTDYTEVPICPWCGHLHRNGWEMEEGENECGKCNKKYMLRRETVVMYCTSKRDEQ